MNNKYLPGIAIVVLLIIGGLVYAKNNNLLPFHGGGNLTNDGEGVLCAQDVMQCTDGSYVSRKPPNCDFAACPNVSTSSPQDVPKETTQTGSVVCLPHKNTSGPQTLECALGLKGTDGYYYGLDTQAHNIDIYQYSGHEETIKVTGTLVPVEQLNTNFWQRYNIKGIISVKTVSKI